MEMNDNPFKAPEARVADVTTSVGSHFVPEGQAVPAGNGANWLVRGWEMFKQAPGPWIGLSVIYIIMTMVLSFIPFLGALALNLLMPVFIGGIMLGCKALDDGEELTVGHLFAGFSNNTTNLILIGALYMAGIIVIVMVVGIGAAIVGVGAAALGAGKLALIPIILMALVAMLLIVPLAMALWFSPALVIFHEVSPLDAMKASFMVSVKNFLPFFIYGLVFLVLAIVATIPIGLGWLVLIPVMMASMYAGYQDMFLRD